MLKVKGAPSGGGIGVFVMSWQRGCGELGPRVSEFNMAMARLESNVLSIRTSALEFFVIVCLQQLNFALEMLQTINSDRVVLLVGSF